MSPDAFYAQHVADIVENDGQLADESYQKLRRYYKNLRENRQLWPFYRYNWTRRVGPMVDLIDGLPRRDTPWSILDAGCGVGTESLMWALQRGDLELLGVDIHQPRIESAACRLPVWEARLGRSLNLTFENNDIFAIFKRQRFDLIWSMEAISHIDPAEHFLAEAYANLNPGGKLVLSDSHLLNPKMLWRIFKMRLEDRRVSRTRDFGEGMSVSYARERLFTVPELARLLKEIGFERVESQLHIFFPRRILKLEMGQSIDRSINQIPLLRQLGGIFTVVAHKK